MEDAGALVFEVPVDNIEYGQVIEIRPYDGKILAEDGSVLGEFEFKSDTILDSVQAGGRINLVIGRGLTNRAREYMGLSISEVFRKPEVAEDTGKGFTLAQKMVGRACGLPEGLVAFAAATGVMPLDMPESVLVRFKGEMQPGITLRDLVHAIPYYAIKEGLLTVEKKGKKNIFSGRILEIEGLEDLKVEQAFELSDASAERSAAGCTIKLGEETISEYLRSNVTMLRWMIQEGYGDVRTLERRARKMEDWLANPELLSGDADAEYAAVIEIDLADVTEPVVCCPNDPDDAKLLSDVAGDQVDEVFLGSCMTNIGHYRAAGELLNNISGSLPTRMWIAPPTRMDEHTLMEEGYYNIYGKVGARTEMPGCSLCMGNQARVADGATVLSTSTRNFPNRLGNGANVYLTSAELASVGAVLGKLPTVAEYMEYANKINSMSDKIFRYMNFNEIASFQKAADEGKLIAAEQIVEVA
eukprot:g4339.t1